jgi:hypothetical protein
VSHIDFAENGVHHRAVHLKQSAWSIANQVWEWYYHLANVGGLVTPLGYYVSLKNPLLLLLLAFQIHKKSDEVGN